MASENERSSLEPWKRLDGKVVMVTGASSGIGLDFCLDLAKAGCKIIAAARRTDRLKSLCEQINQMKTKTHSLSESSDGCSVRAVAVELDVCGTESHIEASVKKGWDAFGRIDALINNAGIRGIVASPLDLSVEEWNNNVQTNLTGTWLVSKHVGRLMRDANQPGSIINISSIAGLNRGQLPGGVAYAAAKSAVNTITRVMGLELGAYKIRVNSISPGLFKSEITQGLMQRKWLNNVAEKTVPLRTYGTSDPALTALVRYLIHDSSEYISGNMFIVDAGVTLPGVPIFSSLYCDFFPGSSVEEWNNTISTNLTGLWLVSKHVGRLMRDANRAGSIINISSTAGLKRVQVPGGVAYAASKSAVNTITEVMSLELGVFKIRVNSISPGLFKSEITEGLMKKSWLNNVLEKTIPLRTFGTSDPALTALVRYLIHESSEYVSGNNFIVDAGGTIPGVPLFSSL